MRVDASGSLKEYTETTIILLDFLFKRFSCFLRRDGKY